MQERQYLMIPGPTPVPPRVLRAMSTPMINHRGPEFSQLSQEVQEGLKKVFQTKNQIMIFPAAGTGAMEASIVNTLSAGDEVLSVSIGAFGDRYAKIAECFGVKVDKLNFEWGRAAEVDKISERLKAKSYKAVLVTHNETSTGVTNDIESIARVVKSYDTLLLVDAISSLAAIDLKTDEWKIDLVVGSSQKALMLPPGLSFISVSKKAKDMVESSNLPKFYWDFKSLAKWMEKGQTPWTPALPQLFGLRESLKILLEEIGLENNFARHKMLSYTLRQGVQALGLELLAEEKFASPTVTAIKVPKGQDVNLLRNLMREKYKVVTAGGQGKLEGKIFRIGHLGFVDKMDILATLVALELSLKELGYLPVASGRQTGKIAEGVFLKSIEEILS